MGQFSWFTQDTNHRIVNGEEYKVIMTDNNGHKYVEHCYEGYGVFGGKDYYELLAEMNGLGSDRYAGIQLAFENSPYGDNPNCLHPSITESGEYMCGKAPVSDPDQGFETYEYDDVWDEFDDDEW
ncbi:MAG: hypothetical protein E7068_02590 [Lentimicrobiaceae bacterium]|nr:hypothetical protein [Lentimicrobiaceae bacterium]